MSFFFPVISRPKKHLNVHRNECVQSLTKVKIECFFFLNKASKLNSNRAEETDRSRKEAQFLCFFFPATVFSYL